MGHEVPTASGAQRRITPRGGTAQPAHPPAASASARRSESVQQADGKNNTLTWVFAGAGLLLAGLGLVLILRGGKGSGGPRAEGAGAKTDTKTLKTESKSQKPEDKVRKPDEVSRKPEDTARKDDVVRPKPEEPEKKAVNPPADEPAPQVKPGFSSLLTNEMDDIREGAARREFARIKDLQKGGKINPFDLRKRLEAYLGYSSFQNTKPGQEARELLQALPVIEARPPDNPANTTPGLQVNFYETESDDVGLMFVSPAAFKAICDKVLPNVDIPNKERLGDLLNGRRERVLARFLGYIEIPRDGAYTFFTNSDDGSLLFIGETIAVSNEGLHAMQERGGDALQLKAGKHAFRVEFQQGNGEAGVIALWQGPDIPKQTIPASAFSH